MKIAITGASGLVGTALSHFLETSGHEVIPFVRPGAPRTEKRVLWDPANDYINFSELENHAPLDALIHLAGEGVANGFWTKDKKRKIYNSRINSTNFLVKTLGRKGLLPRNFISASAIGYYGDTGERSKTEVDEAGRGFLAKVCSDWEQAASAAKQFGTRVVNLRIGLVLSKEGGLLKKMLPAFKLYLGGKLGSGEQYMSWISIEDLVRATEFLLDKDEIQGPVNLVSPSAVTNTQFTKTLGSILNRPTFLNIPEVILKLLPGKMSEEMFLINSQVFPQVLLDNAYEFMFTNLSSALNKELAK